MRVDRRRGAVISLDADKLQAVKEMRRELSVSLARGICHGISREEAHQMVDEIYNLFLSKNDSLEQE